MTTVVVTRTRWHHPLLIAKSRIKKYLAIVGGIGAILAVGFAIGHFMH